MLCLPQSSVPKCGPLKYVGNLKGRAINVKLLKFKNRYREKDHTVCNPTLLKLRLHAYFGQMQEFLQVSTVWMQVQFVPNDRFIELSLKTGTFLKDSFCFISPFSTETIQLTKKPANLSL